MKKRNPIIEQAELRGFEKGVAIGVERGRAQSINFMIDWIDKLEQTPGIGPKTAERIRKDFITKYGR